MRFKALFKLFLSVFSFLYDDCLSIISRQKNVYRLAKCQLAGCLTYIGLISEYEIVISPMVQWHCVIAFEKFCTMEAFDLLLASHNLTKLK